MRKRIEILRRWMQNHHIEAFIVPANDPHFSEYVAPHWGCRAWISGFDGSAGTAVVTRSQAALWTDSRYFLQAEDQLQGSGIELQRSGLADTPTITKWLSREQVKRVGVDGMLFSKAAYERLSGDLSRERIALVCTEDPFDVIWNDRPGLPTALAMLLDMAYSGENSLDKIKRIRETFSEGVRMIAVLDEIAWTLNIRGEDIEYNPLVISYLAIEPERVVLFVDPEKFPVPPSETGVIICPYTAFDEYLKTLGGKPVIVNPNGFDYTHYAQLVASGAVICEEATPYGLVTAMKAIKNQTEIEGFRQTMERDGVALVRFEIWLEGALCAGSQSVPTELEVAEKLHRFRLQGQGFRGESFKTIAGYGTHGAIVHYSATPKSDVPACRDSFLLIDSGGQYLSGTTDITRTYHFGRPTPAQKRDYTAVLKGMIDLCAARFPVGTRGTQLDVLARRHLWAVGENYLHGTGHGIGHFSCVHEGPQSIRMNENPVVLLPGMVQSCEPGLYREGEYGIRIENLTVVTTQGCPDGFLRFEPLTLCPISLAAVDTGTLELSQQKWLNDYHATVYERLAPHLTADERQWLQTKTEPVPMA